MCYSSSVEHKGTDHTVTPNHSTCSPQRGHGTRHQSLRCVLFCVQAGAELVRDPLEDRVVVVVEAAHEAGIDHVLDAGGGDELLHAGEEGAAFLPIK